MESFNRIVTTLLLLAMIPIVTVGLIVPLEAIQLLRDGLERLEGQLCAPVSAGWLLVSVGLAVLIDGALILCVYWQVRRGISQRAISGGSAEIKEPGWSAVEHSASREKMVIGGDDESTSTDSSE